MTGGPGFTFPMTLIFLVNMTLAIRAFIFMGNGKFDSDASAIKAVNTIKHLGVIALTIGILGQIIGLYGAFQIIEANQADISPKVLAGGIKISSVTTILGLVYFILSYVAWMLLRSKLQAAA